MSVDKRSVHTDALQTLGTIIGDSEERDAIHLAVEPVIAARKLKAGQHVSYKDGKAYPAEAYGEGAVGIVDPFLHETVSKGEKFWLVIYPRKIKSLRHVWECDGFPNSTGLAPQEYVPVETPEELAKKESIAWIEDYVDSLNSGIEEWMEEDYGVSEITYDELMEYAMTHVGKKEGWGDYLVKGPLLDGVYTDPEFWRHFEVVTGHHVEDEPNIFSCSC